MWEVPSHSYRADSHRHGASGPHFILGQARRPAGSDRSCQTLDRRNHMHPKSSALALLMLLVACANGPKPPNLNECWEHRIPVTETVTNVLSLCVAGDRASVSIYYPNVTTPSTTCRQAGTVVRRDAKLLALSLAGGTCENGRALRSYEVTCSFEEARALKCTTNESQVPMEFSHASSRSE